MKKIIRYDAAIGYWACVYDCLGNRIHSTGCCLTYVEADRAAESFITRYLNSKMGTR